MRRGDNSREAGPSQEVSLLIDGYLNLETLAFQDSLDLTITNLVEINNVIDPDEAELLMQRLQ